MVVESTLKELDYALVSSTIALVKIFMRHNGRKAFMKLNLNFDAQRLLFELSFLDSRGSITTF